MNLTTMTTIIWICFLSRESSLEVENRVPHMLTWWIRTLPGVLNIHKKRERIMSPDLPTTSSDLWLPTLAVSLFGGFAPPAARQTAAVFFMILAVAPMNEHHVTAAWFGSVSVERNALLIAAWQGSEMWVPSAIERWHSQQSDLPVLIHALRAVLFDRYHQFIMLSEVFWVFICDSQIKTVILQLFER